MIKHKLTTFINELIMYDYILFGSVFSIFVLLVILGILLRKKTFISILLLLLAFSTIILAPTLGYVKMHEFLFKNETAFISQKKLSFTKAIVVHGSVKNMSNHSFSSCKIKVGIYKVSGNEIKDYLFKFNPFKKMSILEYDIKKDEVRNFKAILEPFTYSKDYNISIGASCK